METDDIETLYSAFKTATNKITEKVAGFKKRKQIEDLPSSFEEACEQRRKARSDMIAHPQSQEEKLIYKALNNNVKTAIKVQKPQFRKQNRTVRDRLQAK